MGQYHSNAREQELHFAAFIMGALINDAPSKSVFMQMTRLACNHSELVELEDILRVRDDAKRGGLYAALVGKMLARISREGVLWYESVLGGKP